MALQSENVSIMPIRYIKGAYKNPKFSDYESINKGDAILSNLRRAHCECLTV